MGWLLWILALLSSHWVSDSLWAWLRNRMTEVVDSPSPEQGAPPSEPSLHMFPEGVHAGMIQLQSQPGSSVLEGQLCLLGLPSGQIRLGLSVCVMEVLKPEDRVTLLLPKNHCHLKYKLSDLLWDLCTVSRRNQYVQRTISCLHLRNFL